jgi:lipopolysaccharide/colanic/teichoic acid biosynthesis glycosyltransferase
MFGKNELSAIVVATSNHSISRWGMLLFAKARTSMDLPWRNLAILDLIWGVLAPTLTLWLRDYVLFDHQHLEASLIYIAISGILTAASFAFFKISHRVTRFFSVDDALTTFLASAVAVISVVLVSFLLTRLDNIPRLVPILHFLILATGSIAARIFRYVRRRRRDRRSSPTSGAAENLIIVGVSDLSWYYMKIVDHLMSDRYNVVALLDENKNLQGRYINGFPVAGRMRDIEMVLGEYSVHGTPIHRLVLSPELPALAPELVEQLLRTAEKHRIDVTVLPEQLGLLHNRPALPLATCQIKSISEEDSYNLTFWRLKRALDIAISGIILLAALPLTPFICLFVLFDCGMPLLFWQIRVGRYGRKIAVYKLRTYKAPYGRGGEPVPEEQRISWIGRLLRRTHIDELPQLLAVIWGDMSLTGPRPLLPVDLPEKFRLRLVVRPGITGWAQINGATLVTREEKNALDEWYVRHASLRLELTILAATFRTLFTPMQRNEKAISEALREQAVLKGMVRQTPDTPIRRIETRSGVETAPKLVA